MRIITCASYYGSGSSAVTDYVTEYSTVKSLGNYEFRFLHDTDGIADLEYHLVWNHNRHNSGHAIKRFKKIVDFYAGNKIVSRYEPYFNFQWKKLAYNYIESLVDFSYHGWWQYDLLDRGIFYYNFKQLFSKIYRMTIAHNTEKNLNVLPNEITYCSHPTQTEFDVKTKFFLQELLSAGNPENKPFIMIDQLLPTSNINRFWKFFDDIKAVIVERDPRDLYILEKYVWKGCVIPTETAEIFCSWYRYTREHRKTEEFDTERVMLLQFEDLIYRYEETSEKLQIWLGLEKKDHMMPLKKLNPAESIKNTKLWEKYNIGDELWVIESQLTEYLYDYSALET